MESSVRIGERYGRLVITKLLPNRKCRVKCDCGNITTPNRSNVKRGLTQSCGCGEYEARLVGKNLRHGFYGTPEYKAWSSAIQRCTNPKLRNYKDYGGRGITVVSEWKSFPNFIAAMGLRPSYKHSLDRIDNDGPYAPWNCRWATLLQQARNKRISHGRRLHVG